jgi:uncharacterized membrane protein YdjX (TVP38/TMEM64 family)
MQYPKKVRWLAVVAVVTLIVLALLLLPIPRITSTFQQIIVSLRDAGPGPFFLAMALLPAVGFPLAAFSVVAGPVFGPTLGVGTVVLCAIAATSANVALSYWIAARALRPFVKHVLRWLGYSLPEIRQRHAWPIVLLIRVVPGPPFFLQSYLLAFAKAPFGTYMAISTLVPACYLTATIILGDALSRRDPSAIGAAALIFVAGGTVLHVIRKRLVQRSPDSTGEHLVEQAPAAPRRLLEGEAVPVEARRSDILQ